MSVIRILAEAVANKIAAGEVVERPASVVKELMENSLDAGATRLEVALEAGGKRRICVTDDGCGMSHDDAMLAFERHATSKIRFAEDLYEISTLGFRGEALPSIAAVSRLELDTRHASEDVGTHVEIAGGKIRDVKETAWPQGTRIDVRDLFFNTPPRRKFLKSESTELGHIATLVTHYALAHPEKSFRLESLTNEILNVSPVTTTRERVYQVMGGQMLEQMVEVAPVERQMPPPSFAAPEEENDTANPIIVRVFGFASRPEVQKLNRNQIFFFVNRRLVRDRLILHAITEAYRNILPSGMSPVALVFLEIPAAEVDVNVHPSKTEVRFRRTQFIHDLVRDSIRQALVVTRPVPSFPASKTANISDALATDAAERLSDEPPGMKGAEIPWPRGQASRHRDFQLSPPRPKPENARLPLVAAALSTYAPPAFSGEAEPKLPEMSYSSQASELPADLIPLGQVEESFIVATNPQGLWIVDQHAAHERVLFERHVRQRREENVEGQRLLMPIVIELKPAQQVAYQEIAEELAANGFEVEPFGQRTVAVKSAPAEIRADAVERLLLELLDSLGQEAQSLSLDDLRLKIAASVSCHAAIKINMRLEQSKMVWLLRALGETQAPMTCPHGRPIVLRYGMKELQKAFKRI
ncbi:MAG: DNA mismatch repair endonuclease MutL [Acidobacteria bacterium]|nr:DNA mismatch repair endonuclease MutL [Acidobacteriota bacterium]